jgi:hypothetical protein
MKYLKAVLQTSSHSFCEVEVVIWTLVMAAAAGIRRRGRDSRTSMVELDFVRGMLDRLRLLMR